MVQKIIMKSFKQHIFEKLKVTPNSAVGHKEYKDKTNKITYYNAYNYHKYILTIDSMDLFMDYWYYRLESEDKEFKDNLDLHWDDIYVDDDIRTVYILDNNTGDEITWSSDIQQRTFNYVYNRIMEYFENKNS